MSLTSSPLSPSLLSTPNNTHRFKQFTVCELLHYGSTADIQPAWTPVSSDPDSNITTTTSRTTCTCKRLSIMTTTSWYNISSTACYWLQTDIIFLVSITISLRWLYTLRLSNFLLPSLNVLIIRTYIYAHAHFHFCSHDGLSIILFTSHADRHTHINKSIDLLLNILTQLCFLFHLAFICSIQLIFIVKAVWYGTKENRSPHLTSHGPLLFHASVTK